MVIKASIGKLSLPDRIENMVTQAEKAQIATLPISVLHLSKWRELPFHHRDPFDRILISQALQNDLTVLGTDVSFSAYGVKSLW